MALLCRSVFVGGLLLLAATRLWAASPTENRAFEAAAQKFQDEWYGEAENSFAEFAKTFPASPRLAEAVFYQALARIKLTNSTGALELLSNGMSQAGKWADEYSFWQAEAHFQKEDFLAAAPAFEKVLKDFPASPRRLEAALREASAWAKLYQWPLVINLLGQTNSVFQAAARTNSISELVPLGYLLLGEAHLAQGDCDAARFALQPLSSLKVNPATQWQGQFLLCRSLVADGRFEQALDQTSNLVTLAMAAAQPNLQAETAAFQADLFERLGWIDEAVAVYRQNLAGGVPAERQRQALLKISKLSLSRNKTAEAADQLEIFLGQHAQAESADLALLTLGELRLRQYDPEFEPNLLSLAITNAPAGTNNLLKALTAFQTFTNRFPQSSLVGKAQLDLGWCYWLQGKFAESQGAFQTAVQCLPLSPDLATAYFKLADAQFRQGDFSGAISNYNVIVHDGRFAGLEEVKSNLFAPALYQIVRAGLTNGDLSVATNALTTLRAWHPEGAYTAGGLLLTSQQLSQSDPARARALLLDFVYNTPQSSLLPELRLAIAATYEQENDWLTAVGEYDFFIAHFADHKDQPRAEFSRALANYLAGRYTNALAQFNLIASHTNEFALRARWWEADYYYRIGEQAKAEISYQQIFQDPKWPVSELTYQALMMAARAAIGQQLWKNATKYLFQVAQTQNTNCPAELRGRAYMALADVFISQDSTNKHADLSDAVAALGRVPSLCPTNPLAIQAVGRIGDCQLQWPDYDKASNAYQQVITSPLADVAMRSNAKVGLGLALEKMAQEKSGPEQTALFDLALRQFLNVFYFDEDFLHADEKPDLFWTKEAGMQAARLAETLQRKVQAIHVYQRLQTLVPPLRLEERINRLKAQDEAMAPKD